LRKIYRTGAGAGAAAVGAGAEVLAITGYFAQAANPISIEISATTRTIVFGMRVLPVWLYATVRSTCGASP
jgi:hypothetical protein